jgi:glycosyltransferase involved in cell wall biosynthesis
MNKPRVLLLSTSLNIGGTEKFLFTLLDKLKDKYDFRIGYLKEKGAIGSSIEKRGFELKRFGSIFSLFFYLKKQNFDAVHTFLYRANIVGRLAAKIAGVPVIISTQQAIDDWKKPVHVFLDRWTAAFCDLIIANSVFAKNLMSSREKIPQAKIAVVHNGIDPESFRARTNRTEARASLGIGPDAFVVVSVLRLHKEKGADLLLDIAERAPAAHFVVVGDGPLKASLQTRLKESRLDGRFLLLGFRDDIPDLLAMSDLFLLPSREESFPQAILEAFLAGLPVVASDVGGVRELVDEGKNGFLSRPGNVPEFVDLIDKIRKNAEKGKTMGENGRQKALSFSEKKMIIDVASIYDKLIGG